MTETYSPESLELGILLGQRRAFNAVGGRCSAAHAQLLCQIRDEKLYTPVADSWRAFCTHHLFLSRRHADRLIALLKRFGPVYFELSQLAGISPRQYLAIEPAVSQDRLLVNGEAISLIPANAPRIVAAVYQILNPPREPRTSTPAPAANVSDTIDDLGRRGLAIANRLLALYEQSAARERERILDVTTQIRIILLQPGIK